LFGRIADSEADSEEEGGWGGRGGEGGRSAAYIGESGPGARALMIGVRKISHCLRFLALSLSR